MTYWFEDEKLKNLLPMSVAISGKGLATAFTPPQIHIGANVLPDGARVGRGAVGIIATKCPKKRAFIVTDKIAERFCGRVVRAFEGRGFVTEIWNETLPEAPLDNVKAAAEAMREFEPDVILAVGGGSIMDLSKAAWILYEREDITDLAALLPNTPLRLRKKAILVAFPTTAGTGSECTSVAVVTDKANHRKIPVANRELMADYALLIPEFTFSMPAKLTAGTGLDVMAHAGDAMLVPNGDEISDALGGKALEMVFRWLPRAYRNGKDREARQRMLVASTIAGMAFQHSSVALTHAAGHSLGAIFGVHHGLAVGMFLPYCMQFYKPVSEKWKGVAKALDVHADDDEVRFEKLVAKVKGLIAELEGPLSIKEAGVEEAAFKENLDRLVLDTMADVSVHMSPRPVNKDDCRKIFEYAYEGKDIDF